MCFFLCCEQTPNALQMGHIPRIQELPAAPAEEEGVLPHSGLKGREGWPAPWLKNQHRASLLEAQVTASLKRAISHYEGGHSSPGQLYGETASMQLYGENLCNHGHQRGRKGSF